jgi:hypothetical protein
MNILKSITTPFVASRRWIKETAWVQPLLIVGVIFAVIFSIPSITKAVQNAIAAQSADIEWYKNYRLSLDGTANDDSQANLFFDNYVSAQNSWFEGQKDEARETMSRYNDGTGKFYLFFAQTDCTACSELKEASVYLIDNWETTIAASAETNDVQYTDFKYQSIIADEEVDDDIYDTTKPFAYLYGYRNYIKFTEDVNGIAKYTYYYKNLSDSEQSTYISNLQNLIYSDPSSSSMISDFQTPLVVLFDMTDQNKTNNIVTQVFFKINGSDKYSRADFVADSWTGAGVFSEDGK